MTKWFCDRCGNEIQEIKGAYMSMRTRVATYEEHECLLCERCAQEFKCWYLEGEK